MANRLHLLLAILLGLLLSGMGFNIYYYSQAVELERSLESTSEKLSHLSATVKQIKATAPKARIEVDYVPLTADPAVSGSCVTYITAAVNVSGLSSIPVQPIVLIVEFTVETEQTGNGTVQVNYIQAQRVELPSGVDYVTIPWGAFPITISGFKPGDEVRLKVKVEVKAVWSPVDTVVAYNYAYHTHILKVA